MLNCHYCLGASGTGLTNEHLVSNPVADAFGIDRWGDLSTVDLATLTVVASRPLEQLKARIACDSCNSGWMHQLEDQMPAVADWVSTGIDELGADRLRILKRWLLKTHIVLAAIEGGTRQFGTDKNRIIPLVSIGKALYEGNDDVLDVVRFGFARRVNAPSNHFNYKIETPEVLHANGKQLNRRAASVSVISVGQLECWTVAPMLAPCRIGLPAPLVDLDPGTRFEDLPLPPPAERISLVQVDYQHADLHKIFPA